MVVNILFLVTMYPVMFILYMVMRNMGDAKNGYSFGARMKPEWMKDESVKQIVAEYKKALKREVLILAVIPLLTFAIPYLSIAFTVWMIWFLAALAVPAIPFVRANARLRERKAEMGWSQQNGGYTYTDLESAKTGVRRVKLLPYLPPLAISMITGVWGLWRARERQLLPLGIMAMTFALLTLLFYGAAVWMDRQKNEVVSRDSDVNINYNRAKKNLWKNIWLCEAWLNTIFTVIVIVTLGLEDLWTGNILAESILYTIAGILPLLLAARKLRQIDVHYAEYRDLPEDEDDGDGHWLGGMLYYNKNDSHTMVTMRAGIGTTMNLATPAGFGLTAFGLAVLLVVPLCCIWLMLEEFTPLKLSIEQQALTAEHLRVEYEIPLSEISEAELTEDYPVWSKVAGTNMEHLLKGTFHVRNDRDYEVFLDPQNEVFLRIQTADEVYYMSASDDETTRGLYEEIRTYTDDPGD